MDPQRPPKVTEMVPKIVVKNDAGKRPVSDASKHSKHSSRASGDTVFTRAKDHQKVTKMMPNGTQKRRRTIKKALWKHVRNHIKISCQKKQKCLQRAPQRHPKETPKSSTNEPWGPPGPPMAPQSGPRCPTEQFCSILGPILLIFYKKIRNYG